MTGVMTREQIQEQVLHLGKWFHNINLQGVQTAPDHFLGDYPTCKWQNFSSSLPADLTGKTVLDIGCNAGFYSIQMKLRGAEEVLGIDSDSDYLEQARFAARVSKVEIDFRELDVYQVAKLGKRFDVVLFMGVLYHLRHPLLALDLLHDHVVGELLVFQSLIRGYENIPPIADNYSFQNTDVFNQRGYPLMHFVEKSYADDPTNWWIPNRAGVEAMLRSSGFDIRRAPEDEVYICKRRNSRD